MANYYNKDLYKILEITPSATTEEIKTAYRKLVRMYHPDVAGKSANITKFKEIKDAYEILIDTKSREKYNLLHGFFSQTQEKKSTKQESKFDKTNYKNTSSENQSTKTTEKQKDTNKTFAQSLNDAIDGLFTSENKQQKSQKTQKQEQYKPKSVNGKDITMEVSISYLESINGTSRKINILHTEPCPNCQGKKFLNETTCKICNGTGEVSVYKKINVKIPAGVVNSSKIRIKGEGNDGLYGGKAGDLFLFIKISDDTIFKYDELNVLCEAPITPFEAVLGAEIHIPAPEGSITMKIPPLTSSGQKFRLTDQGITDNKTGAKGDFIVTVKIVVPKDLTEKEIQLYKELRHISKSNVRENLQNGK